jgi:hypothetical protein
MSAPLAFAVLAVLTVLAGCGSKQTSTKTEAPTCASIAPSIAAANLRPDADAKVSAALEAVVEQRCREDKWSDEARTCLATEKDTAACWSDHIGKSQHEALNKELADAIAKNTPTNADADADTLAVVALEPARGDMEGGTYVVLQGNRFLKDGPRSAKVYFGSRQGTIVRFQSDTQLIVQAPGGKDGEVVDVLVIFEPGGQLKLEKAFTFVAKQ